VKCQHDLLNKLYAGRKPSLKLISSMEARMYRVTTLITTAVLTIVGASGCASMKTSDTSRTGTEQLLVTNAVDEALDKVDFRPFREHNVFLQDKYVDCTDKNYVISSVRHRIMSQGALLVDDPAKADIVVELRAGVVGTDRTESFLGIPEINLPAPMPIALPEMRWLSKTTQYGTAKIGLVAYNAQTNEVLGDGGMSSARSDNNNWFVMGVGPWQTGTVKKEIQVANTVRPTPGVVPNAFVAFNAPEKEPFSPNHAPLYHVSEDPEADTGLE